MTDQERECLENGMCPTQPSHPCLTLVTLRDYLEARFDAAETASKLLAENTVRERDAAAAATYALKSDLADLRADMRRELEERRERFDQAVSDVRDRLDKETMVLHEFRAQVSTKANIGHLWITLGLAALGTVLGIIDLITRLAR